MSTVRSTLVVGGAADRLAEVASEIEAALQTVRSWSEDYNGMVVSPPAAVGPDVSVTLDTVGLGADTVADMLAQAFPQSEVAVAFAGRVDPEDPEQGEYAFNEDAPDKVESRPTIPSAADAASTPSASSDPSWVRSPTLVPEIASETELGPEPAAPLSLEASGPGRLCLTGGNDHTLTFGIRTVLNQRGCRGFGEDARFWDNIEQCRVEPVSGGWQVVPNPGATNETLLNGRAISEAVSLHSGDRLAVGRESKGIEKLPLQVSFQAGGA